ncbi:MAG: EamA family transporter [Alphaproteobacteria bacterium]|nr:EamA family transporter [Alphaproteobacteria bacterium]
MITTRAMSFPNKSKGLLLMGLGIFLLSVGEVFLKTLSSTYSPFQIMFMRSLLALPILFLLLKRNQNLSAIFCLDIKAQVLRNGILSCASLLCIYSLSLLPLAEYSVLFFSKPLFIALLSIFLLGKRLSKIGWLCILTGFIGVAIALNPVCHHMIQWGGIAVLTSAFLYGVGAVLTSKQGRQISSLILTIWHAMAYVVLGLCGTLHLPFSFHLADLPYFLEAGLR